jgi:hypothetical protein
MSIFLVGRMPPDTNVVTMLRASLTVTLNGALVKIICRLARKNPPVFLQWRRQTEVGKGKYPAHVIVLPALQTLGADSRTRTIKLSRAHRSTVLKVPRATSSSPPRRFSSRAPLLFSRADPPPARRFSSRTIKQCNVVRAPGQVPPLKSGYAWRAACHSRCRDQTPYKNGWGR